MKVHFKSFQFAKLATNIDHLILYIFRVIYLYIPDLTHCYLTARKNSLIQSTFYSLFHKQYENYGTKYKRCVSSILSFNDSTLIFQLKLTFLQKSIHILLRCQLWNLIETFELCRKKPTDFGSNLIEWSKIDIVIKSKSR